MANDRFAVLTVFHHAAVDGASGMELLTLMLDEHPEGTEIQPPGLLQYLVVHGQARLTDGGAPELLQELAHRYLGPDVKFPPMPGPPPGVVMHIAVDRLGGIGPWPAPRS